MEFRRSNRGKQGRKHVFFWIMLGVLIGVGLMLYALSQFQRISTDEYCESCHVHPQAIQSWKEGPHYKTPSGVVVSCVECHLPPVGFDHVVEKAKAGTRDLYGFYFKEPSEFDWELKSTLEEAARFTYDESCSRCHVELFPLGMTEKGVDAHIHYQKNRDDLNCINCHLTTGHYHEAPSEMMVSLDEPEEEVYEMAPLISEIPPGELVDYTEVIPGMDVKFEMVAIQGGTFMMGSPPDHPLREEDEVPQRQVQVSPFWIGKFEVSWREYDAYYSQTVTHEKNEQGEMSDAMTGPTPPYGSPDQGWGKGSRPAITMTHYAARKYCEWLSIVTGRKYRLPTEAEWEYAARAGTTGAYFFAEETPPSWWEKLFGSTGIPEEQLAEYAWYRGNSKLRTHPPRTRLPSPWGLHNILGNVKEFCLDRYRPDAYSSYPEGIIVDPRGPEEGEEYVIRGGSYMSEPADLRSSARDRTNHKAWLKTDPQNPKSVWWYSDSKDVGFRVVREFDSDTEEADHDSNPE